MNDSDKTKEQLINELNDLRTKIEEFNQKELGCKQVEYELRLNEEKYRQLFNKANDAIQLHEISEDGKLGRFIEVNDLACQRLGYNRDEFLTLTPDDIDDHEKAPVKPKLIQELLSKGSITFEMIHVTKAGQKIPIEISSHMFTLGGKRVVLSISRDITERKQAEKLFRILSNSAPIGIYIIQDGNFKYVNPQFIKDTGYSENELMCIDTWSVIHPEDRDRVKKNAIKALKGESDYPYQYRADKKNGEVRLVMEKVASIDYLGGQATLGYYMDITEHKQMKELLQMQAAAMEASIDGMAILDKEENYIYLNDAHAKIYGYDAIEELAGKRWDNLYGKREVVRFKNKIMPELYKKRHWRGEAIGKKRDGSKFNQEISLSLINEGGLVCVVRDISERKKMEEKLRYLSTHDPLTGLYNRTYFEEEMRRLSSRRGNQVCIILCDLDGLKLINDTLGHDTGDKLLVQASKVLKKSFRSCDVVARVGGDEFAIIIDKCNGIIAAEMAQQRLRDTIEVFNAANPRVPLNISIGYAVNDAPSSPLSETFEEADNNMYKEKLHRSNSARSAVVLTLMKALEARDFITEGHADRLQDLVAGLAKEIGLTNSKINDLRLLARFHDIGKVGIPDRILFKPGPLIAEEIKEMQRHSEIGFRIAQSSPDLLPISDWILKHHEWWNGSGYPFGLKGEQIPQECRILAIADAYDAITSDRPYRKARTHSEAIIEIKKCSGSQFDPKLIEIFVRLFSN